MKAIIYTNYGPPDVLRIADVSKDDEVLIQQEIQTVHPIHEKLMSQRTAKVNQIRG